MNRALQFATRSTFFAAENGQYRYWLKNGVLKLQAARKVLKQFLDSEVGKRMQRYVDMFEVGGGWFEVHAGDTSELDRITGYATHTNGLRMWVKALNEFFFGAVNANRPTVLAVYGRGKAVAPGVFQMNKFSPSSLHAKHPPIPPEQSPVIEPRQRPASPKMLEALAAKFAH